MTKDLSEHRALVTGASSGIGEEYARQLAARGAALVISARRKDRLIKLASDLQKKYGVNVDIVELDLSSPGAAEKLFNAATSAGKPITILINNAGVGKWNEFWNPALSDHQQTMQLNMVAPTELAYLFVHHMRTHGKTSYIKNVSSVASFQPVTGFAVYSGTKAYLTYLSEILDEELKGSQVHVTCLCPGGTLTEFLDQAGQKMKNDSNLGMMTAESVVRIGIDGMLKNRRLVIPGVLNQIACFLGRILPRKTALWLTSKAMRTAVKKA